MDSPGDWGSRGWSGSVQQLGEAVDKIARVEVDFPPELIRWEPSADKLAQIAEKKNFVDQVRYPYCPWSPGPVLARSADVPGAQRT